MAAGETGYLVSLARRDAVFHLALVAASGNEALHMVMLAVKDSMKLHLDEALRSISPFAEVRAKLTGEHRALLAAVEGGDARRAAKILADHLAFYGT